MNVEIISINDESGSMYGLRSDLIGGYNAFLAEQQAQPGQARMTLVKFNYQRSVVYRARDLATAPLMTEADYTPCGGTALFDAIGQTLKEEAERIAAEGWADKVIVTINTDGEENASQEYTQEQVRAMITHAQEKGGYSFIFQGANQDAFTTGAGMGISAATTQNYVASGAGLRGAYASTSSMVNQMRAEPFVAADPIPLRDLVGPGATFP